VACVRQKEVAFKVVSMNRYRMLVWRMCYQFIIPIIIIIIIIIIITEVNSMSLAVSTSDLVLVAMHREI